MAAERWRTSRSRRRRRRCSRGIGACARLPYLSGNFRRDIGHALGRPAERARPRALPVRLHRHLPLPVPGLHHRAGELPRGAGRAVAVDGARGLPRRVPLLAEGLRRGLRHGRRLGPGHVLPVRHQLVGLRRPHGAGARAAAGLRGADGLLPRSRLPRRDAVRPRARRQRAALRRHLPGRGRHADLGLLDPVGQFLDAHAGRLLHRRRTGASCRRTGGRSSSTRPSRSATCTP